MYETQNLIMENKVKIERNDSANGRFEALSAFTVVFPELLFVDPTGFALVV